jgi:hypothetical protein
MIGTVLGQVTGQLERRFILNAFFPVLVFALAIGAALAAASDGPVAAVEAWEGESAATKVLTAIAVVSGVFLLANLLSNGMQWVISFFEGYTWPTKLLAPSARKRQLALAKKLLRKASEDESAADRFQNTFPVYPPTLTERDVAPTRLGNILRSAESYPKNRYGVDAVRAWSRFSSLLPDPIISAMTAARTSMEFLLAVSLLSGLYAAFASVYFTLEAVDLKWILLALSGGLGVSFSTYFAALAPAAVYGQQIRAAFDLHRLDLLRDVGMPIPATLEEERRVWGEFHRFLDRGEANPHWRYVISK